MSKADVYSPYKFVHHREHIDALKAGQQTAPLHVQFVPSNVCNNGCVFCPYRSDGYTNTQMFDPRQMLPYEKIIECLDDFQAIGVKSILYTGGGEPFCHPQMTEIISETLDRKLSLGLFTNGLALTERACEELGDAAFVRVSLNAASPDVYHTVHSVSAKKFDRVVENICQLAYHKSHDCTLGVSFVVSRENWQQIYRMAELAKTWGVDNIRFSGASTSEGYAYFDGFGTAATEQAALAKEDFDSDEFTVFNLLGDRLKDMQTTEQISSVCRCKDLITYVGADYSVYLCCILAYNQKGLIGSIKDQSFRSMWESDEKHQLFDRFRPDVVCKGHICTYKGKNEFIDYCCRTDPRDVNFI